jgi:hypothetical protein
MLPFSKVTDVVRDARQTPVKRFYAMFDSCFSGQMVDGGAAIRPGNSAFDERMNRPYYSLTANEAEASQADQFLKVTADTYADAAAGSFYESSPIAKIATQAFEQLIVISASQRYETSLATGEGSQFTNALKRVFKRMKTDNPNATIGQFIDAIKAETKASTGGHHTPAARVMPEEGVMDDTLFIKPVRQQRQDSLQQQRNDAPPNAAPAIAVALGAADQASGSARVYVNVESSIARVGLCSGRRDACVRAASVFLEFRDAADQAVFPAADGRKTLESAKPLKLAAAKPVTFLGFDAAGKVVVSRTIQFRPK